MTSFPSESDRTQSGPAADDREIAELCTAYLLGEMSPAEASAFETRLASDPHCNRQLLLHAELVCALGAPVTAAPVSVHSSMTHRLVAAILAVSASIAIAWLALSDSRGDQRSAATDPSGHNAAAGDEALLIAQAWAAGPITAASPVSGSADEIATEMEPDFDLAWVEQPSDESVPDWILTAVTSEAASPGLPAETGETSDG